MAAKSSVLLRGGTVLTHSADDHVIPLYDTDVLVRDNVIAEVRKNIAPLSEQTEIIDCQGKIVSPGFVDTHHHLWQTQLKGRHAEQGLLSYMVSGNMMSYAYTSEDAYWGQLSGCLEALNAGTTLVLDHAHLAYTPEHANSALSATIDSGIRSIFAYTVPFRLSHWDQSSCTPSHDLLPDWAMKQLEDWVEKYNRPASTSAPEAPGIVEVGMGFDLWFLPKEMVLDMFERLRKKGLRVLTTHTGRNVLMGLQSIIPMFSSYNLLRPPYPPSDNKPTLPFLLLSHCNGIPDTDLSLLTSTGTPVSSTPDTESQMMGFPLALHPAFQTTRSANASLGIDCHSNNPSSIPLQARALLYLTRAETNSHITADDKFPSRNVTGTSETAFNLATIRGARCLGLDSEVGSIAKGKRADLVVFDAQNSVGMLGAAEYDPVVAVVRFSETADIETVIVNGVVRKRDGKLVDVSVSADGVSGKRVGGTTTITPWSRIAEQVRKTQREIQVRIDKLNLELGRETLLDAWHVDQTKLVDV
ncbi:uncharacterized protein Z518_09284 [Rhinocladiella mackenziei CBS 650.93]|uniref:Amidohydrolase-related domain-containing protein n=1 Tax=Rhinocladiella mackenziei CBS 650.93 TaxID=1442369 RepID=A0A0D2GTC1_9EURO|nr:uncharacterized protein Z518_09284 [Rhinocladiella mackenziei CBS 650.93]KIX01558.1 hypothetical protein Z518_09284 [Rhinocladiella mackenziei CBS 650.93]